jgi:putative hydrolase of the HAD superfamily
MPTRGVLFDLDDTLFDHNHATEQALAALCVEEPAFTCWPVAELRARHSALLEEVHIEVLAGRMTIPAARHQRFRRLLQAATNTDVVDSRPTRLAAFYRAAYEQHWQPVPGAVALLTAVRAAGLGIAIVTNNLVAEQRDKLQRCRMDVLIDALVTSEETCSAKPDAAIFQVALDQLALTRDDVVMIGDAWATDILGAQAAGIRPVWCNWRGSVSPDPNVAEIRTLEPTTVAVQLLTQIDR